jgi:7,8-dihydro-6-hydroxymethylpterin-pyrophosphokinase
MSETEQILDVFVESQGWTKNTVLDLCLTYIENQSSPEAWRDYLASLAEVDDDMEPIEVTTVCIHCDREIGRDKDGRWVDPEATGDDSIWRDTCDSNHEDRIAAHEPMNGNQS